MSKELKGLIDSVESSNQAESKLKITIRNLKEEIKRLNFTIGEQRSIIQNQKSMLSNTQNNNIAEDISELKNVITQQRQDIVKKDKDVEILQQTIGEITVEYENVQQLEGENEKLIYANKEIVQLTEENENLKNALANLQKEKSDYKEKAPGEESSDLLDAKKLIIKLTEENGINLVEVESLKQEIENQKKQNQENEATINQFSHELIEVNKIVDQLTFDNDQYHEKINSLQHKLEEPIILQDELPKNDGENSQIEELNNNLFELEIENNDYKNLVNTNFSIIENLKQRNIDMEKKLGEEINFVNQKISDLQEKVSEKDQELNSASLKLQKFENANIQLSDLIVELKVNQEQKGESIEFESSTKSFSHEGLPPNLFFRMYKLLGENDKIALVSQLIEDLSSGIRDVRSYAIKVLSVIKGNRVFEALKVLVNDNDWIVKLYLIKAFRNFNKAETIPLLKKMQEDKDSDVREAAARVLLELKRS